MTERAGEGFLRGVLSHGPVKATELERPNHAGVVRSVDVHEVGCELGGSGRLAFDLASVACERRHVCEARLSPNPPLSVAPRKTRHSSRRPRRFLPEPGPAGPRNSSPRARREAPRRAP